MRLCTEIYVQHKNDFNLSFIVNLVAPDAIKIIDFLKARKHWYSYTDPWGGIQIPLELIEEINNDLLEKAIFPILDNYEIIVGFTEEQYLPDQGKSSMLALNLYSMNKQYLLSRFLFQPIVYQDFPENRFLSVKEVRDLIHNIRAENGMPFNIISSDYYCKLEQMNKELFLIDRSYGNYI